MRVLNAKVLVLTLMLFVLVTLLLLVINRFVFSWMGLISNKLGFCDHRSIIVPSFNGANKKLTQSYDIPHIAEVMRTKPDYEVGSYNGDGLLVSRTFNGVKYNLILEKHNGVSELNLNTNPSLGPQHQHGQVRFGEECTTPSYVIEKNVSRIIDDLPLSDLQKSEIKQYVRVADSIHGKLF